MNLKRGVAAAANTGFLLLMSSSSSTTTSSLFYFFPLVELVGTPLHPARSPRRSKASDREEGKSREEKSRPERERARFVEIEE